MLFASHLKAASILVLIQVGNKTSKQTKKHNLSFYFLTELKDSIMKSCRKFCRKATQNGGADHQSKSALYKETNENLASYTPRFEVLQQPPKKENN